MPWTITCAGYSGADVATIGITGLRYTIQNGLKDYCTFFMPVDAVSTAPFSEKDNFTLSYGGTVRFRGYVERCTPSATGTAEGWNVEVSGKGQLLDVCPYTQTLPITGASTAEFSAGITLGYDSGGVRLNIADTITDIIENSSRHGLTAGTILSTHDVTAPLMDVSDVTVGEALRRVLAWVPDAVLWYDHSANTINVEQPANLSSVSIPGSGTGNGIVENTRDGRRRKAVEGVKIIWRKTSTVDEGSEIDVFVDDAGTTTGPWTPIVTIDLAGSTTLTQSEKVVTADLPEDVGDLVGEGDFLKEHWPELIAANPLVNQLVIHSVTQEVDAATYTGEGDPPDSYPRYLKSGNVPSWHPSLTTATVKLTVVLRPGTAFGANAKLQKLFTDSEKLLTLTKTFTGTNAQSITYRQLVGYDAGDEPVAGLADAWLAALNSSEPAGTVRIVDDEPLLSLNVGKRITLTGDLAVSNGVVQALTVDVDAGETLITYGPQSRLTPQEFVELQRAGSRRSPLSGVGGASRTSATPTSRDIKGSTSPKADSVAHKMADTSGWFRITQTSPTQVKVGEGCIYTPDWSSVELTNWLTPLASGSGTAVFNQYCKSIFGDASSAFTVVNGDKIWVKVALTASIAASGPWFTGYASDMAEEPTSWPATVDMVYQFISASALVPAGYTASATQPADIYSGGVITHTFVCIGSIAKSGDVITITQGQCGALFIPGYIIPIGGPQDGWPEPDPY